jgi:2-keto-4-pentenoate hydratase/2-oxohepta-3-ene-1,7-dioic acid hydratase in catechol pathway
MAFPVSYLIRYISHVMTLEPGDVISTGTPAGVGPLADGDVVEIEVEGVGLLTNPVRAGK